MTVHMPRPNAPLVQGGSAPMDRDWLQWMRDLSSKVQSILSPEDWHYVTNAQMLNGWVNMATDGYDVSYRKTADGMVHMRGWATGGTINRPGFLLPTGYRPSKQLKLACSSFGTALIRGTAIVHTDGYVWFHTSSNVQFHLDGIGFWAD